VVIERRLVQGHVPPLQGNVPSRLAVDTMFASGLVLAIALSYIETIESISEHDIIGVTVINDTKIHVVEDEFEENRFSNNLLNNDLSSPEIESSSTSIKSASVSLPRINEVSFKAVTFSVALKIKPVPRSDKKNRGDINTQPTPAFCTKT
jgi:hypothetical protein